MRIGASIALIAPLALGASACQSINSQDVRTSGLYASFSVVTDDSRSVVQAALKVGGALSNTFVDLSGGDELTAYAGMDSQRMARNELLGGIWYTATFLTTAEDTQVRVDLERPSTMSGESGISAPNSWVTLPAPFTLTAPSPGATASRRTALTITWASMGEPDRLTYDVEGSCITPATGEAADSGALTIPAGALAPARAHADETCPVTVSLSRSRQGVVDGHYGDGGLFTAAQVRQVVIDSTP